MGTEPLSVGFDHIDMSTDAIAMRSRVARDMLNANASNDTSVPWTLRQHFIVDVPELAARAERAEAAEAVARDDAARLAHELEIADARFDDYRAEMHRRVTAEADLLRATVERVRQLAWRWAAEASESDWGESMAATVQADAGRAVLAALDAQRPAEGGPEGEGAVAPTGNCPQCDLRPVADGYSVCEECAYSPNAERTAVVPATAVVSAPVAANPQTDSVTPDTPRPCPAALDGGQPDTPTQLGVAAHQTHRKINEEG